MLVTGASGGVGSAAVALLAQAGFEVVASSGKTAEHDYLKDLGAAAVVGRQFTEDDGRTLGPQLWAGVVDCVGGSGAGRGAAHGPLRRRGGGQRAHRWQRPGHDRLPVHRPRRGAARRSTRSRRRSRSDGLWTEMADAFPLEHCERHGQRGDRAGRADGGAGPACSTPPCAGGSWWRQSPGTAAASGRRCRSGAA